MADEPTRHPLFGTSSRSRKRELRVWLCMLSLHGEIFTRLNRALSSACGLSIAKFDVLAQLDRCPEGMTLGQLSRRLKVTGGNVSGLVRRLVADGLITREMSSTDRRSFLVGLTPAGKTLFDQACVVHQAELQACFEPVSARELDAVLRALDRLNGILPDGT